jgi:hypothetical protein
MPQGGLGSVYIALRVQREPLDQTELSNGIDAIIGGGEGIFWKLMTDRAHRRPGGPPGSPSGSAAVWCPLVSFRSFLRQFYGGIAYLILTCRSFLTVFWIYLVEITYSPKLVKFVSLSP